ncbi:hypothetical protein B0T16DRAFT_387626 [Cercophora newfieldiana]|uniref:Uncharacterized protein n=1 Tax=Cercophora newfieldiana TaxID=92897 RepID=A0AA39YI34_9PEZI|nr:hypothetical protein B0T16DRAFT_387626 [Cercophora newfieldiana]
MTEPDNTSPSSETGIASERDAVGLTLTPKDGHPSAPTTQSSPTLRQDPATTEEEGMALLKFEIEERDEKYLQRLWMILDNVGVSGPERGQVDHLRECIVQRRRLEWRNQMEKFGEGCDESRAQPPRQQQQQQQQESTTRPPAPSVDTHKEWYRMLKYNRAKLHYRGAWRMQKRLEKAAANEKGYGKAPERELRRDEFIARRLARHFALMPDVGRDDGPFTNVFRYLYQGSPPNQPPPGAMNGDDIAAQKRQLHEKILRSGNGLAILEENLSKIDSWKLDELEVDMLAFFSDMVPVTKWFRFTEEELQRFGRMHEYWLVEKAWRKEQEEEEARRRTKKRLQEEEARTKPEREMAKKFGGCGKFGCNICPAILKWGLQQQAASELTQPS